MKHKLNILKLLSLLAFFSLSIHGVSGQTWEPTNGPYGGNVNCFADNGSYLFVGTGSGIYGVGTFRSNDNGDSWIKVNGLTTLNALAVSGPYTIASTAVGVKRSQDNGETWTSTNFSQSSVPICFLAYGTDLYCGSSFGLLVSTDDGMNWTPKNSNFPGITPPAVPYVTSMAICGPYLYIGTGGKGVYRSLDNGETWERVIGGLGTTPQITSKTFSYLLVNGTDIIAGTTSKGIFRLINNGTTWTEENSGLTPGAKYVSSLMIKDNYVYCSGSEGLWRSNNTGTMFWTQINADRCSKLLVKGQSIFNGRSGGICRSDDDCATWTLKSQGITGFSVRQIIKGNGSEILAATYEGGIYKTVDQGANWELASLINSANALILKDTTLFASAGCSEYRSTDNGISWEILPQCPVCAYTHYLKGDTLFAGGSSELGAYYSTDNGDTWNGTSGIISLAPSGGWTHVLSFANNGSNMFAGTDWGVFKSIDNGLTWASCYPALTKDIPFACLASNGTYIFAGSSNYWEDPSIPVSQGIYRSSDNGESWISINNGLGSLDVRTLVFKGTDLYAGTLGGVFKSSDNGDHWTAINEGYVVAPKSCSLYFEDNYMYSGNWTVPLQVYRRQFSGSVPVQPSAITGSASPCIGSSQIYSVTNVPGVTYAWQFPAGWVITAGGTTNSVTVTVGSTAGAVLVTPSNGWGSGPAQVLIVTPIPTINPSVSITADPGSVVYEGTTVTYTATVQNGGASPSYQWYVNGVADPINGLYSTYTYIPVNGDQIKCELTPVEVCSVPAVATSNIITMQVTVIPIPIAYDVTGGGSYCQGGIGLPVGLANSESGIIYTLYKDGVAQLPTVTGTGSAISFGNQLAGTYTVTGTNISVINQMVGSAVITEIPTVNVSVTISESSNNICEGTSVTYSATPVGGGTTPAYQWYVNSSAVATGNTYTYIPENGDVVYVVMTSNAPCAAGNPATSNPITMVVNQTVTPGVTITVNQNNVCAGTSVTFTANPVAGGTAPTYQWFKNGIAIMTGETYTDVLENGDMVNVVMTSNAVCVSNGNAATSNTITMIVNPLPAAAGVVNGPATVCAGSMQVEYSVAEISGANSYFWVVPTGATITSGAGTNAITVEFSLNAVSGIVQVHGTNSCGNGAASPVYIVTVNAIPATPVITLSVNILTSNAPTGNQWYKDGVIINGATSASYEVTADGTYYTIVTLNGCSSGQSNSIQILHTGVIENGTSQFEIYPIPSNGLFNVMITWPVAEKFDVKVYNNTGSLVYEKANIPVNGSTTEVIDLRGTPTGIYMVTFTSATSNISQKIIINKN